MWQLPDIKPADLALISENTDGDNDGEDVMFFYVLSYAGQECFGSVRIFLLLKQDCMRSKKRRLRTFFFLM